MNFDNYRLFNTEDFILDENFLKLAKGYPVEGITLDQLKKHLPEKSKEITLATEILKGLTTKKADIHYERKTLLLRRIFQFRRTQYRLVILRYAASLLLLTGLGTSGYFFFTGPSDIENFVTTTQVDSNKAELILADGKRIEIESIQSKIEYTPNGNTISLDDTTKYEQSQSASGKIFNQIIVPFGKRSSILLPDGSRVWLNSGSRLVYPTVFKDKSREVFLEGEAYFEVSINKSKPFFVRTDALNIKVLGTRFSVQAFKSEKEYFAVLLEGKVSLSANSKMFKKEYELSPNQKATLSETKDDINITSVENADNYIAWIYGFLNFENEGIQSLTKRISRYYNIEIDATGINAPAKFSGKLDLKENPERILDGLSKIFKIKYKKQEYKFVFYE
jgi:transmembrane sensor